ncbi:MAG: hypothetical protein GXY76_12775 [Chloroflexi bacterium]|nr:hypothetical protein [Chloroflexota bacterium]
MHTAAGIARTSAELRAILSQAQPARPLVSAIADLAGLADGRGSGVSLQVLRAARAHLAALGNIPQTTYTLYREFQRNGERRGYETPYFAKRDNLGAAALSVLLGDRSSLDHVHDYLNDICEETTWVIPACEPQTLDLFNAGTAFLLAETLAVLDGVLADEVKRRVTDEIERRVMTVYLEGHEGFWWYKGANNWNGVCNGAVGATFLLLEQDIQRLAEALEYVLAGLEVFFSTAFEVEGSSTEGAAYWQYGLSNVIPFAEMLRHRTAGAIDILGTPRLRQIARYPLHVMLSPGRYASYSDCDEQVSIAPGLVARLAERTGVAELLDLLAEPAPLALSPGHTTPPWRHIAWWDGKRPERVQLGDEWLQDAGVVRLVGATPSPAPVVLVAKAGHNAENHNHNDVGTFILHIDGETFLTDPGRGLYSRSYFSPARYENPFCSSFGHSLPVIGGQLQAAGAAYRGEIVACDLAGPSKRLVMSIGGAYPVPELRSLTRTLTLGPDGQFDCEDRPDLQSPLEVEEAFVTWLEVTVSGAIAKLTGQRHVVELSIAEPAGARFHLEVLEEASRANAKPALLKRLSFRVPAGSPSARVQARLIA